MTQSSPEPIENLTIDDSKVTLLGTAHVSQASADMVEQLIDSKAYQAVAVELCPSRYQALVAPDQMAKMDLMQVIRQGKASMVITPKNKLALGTQSLICQMLTLPHPPQAKLALGTQSLICQMLTLPPPPTS